MQQVARPHVLEDPCEASVSFPALRHAGGLAFWRYIPHVGTMRHHRPENLAPKSRAGLSLPIIFVSDAALPNTVQL